MTSPFWVYILGFIGMTLYGVRLIVQWYKSEKAGKVVSPGIYWVMSSIGAVVLYLYGWLRKDFSIIFGESVGYYIYMWNIAIMGMYKKVPRVVIILQALFPVAIIALMMSDLPQFTQVFLRNPDVPPGLLAFGMLGQFIFEIRSLYQLVISYRQKKSVLPLGHWILAVVGGLMIIIYGLIRHDWVLVIGQSSIVLSFRNIMIHFASQRRERKNLGKPVQVPQGQIPGGKENPI
jgi:lipid-A-disaccharide synthase-like uncharacterized protein